MTVPCEANYKIDTPTAHTHRCNWDTFQWTVVNVAVDLGTTSNFWQNKLWNFEKCAQMTVPIECLQIHEHRSRRIRDIGGMHTVIDAAGQMPQYPCIQCAELALPIVHGLPYRWHILQQPFAFYGTEAVAERQTAYRFQVVGFVVILRQNCAQQCARSTIIPSWKCTSTRPLALRVGCPWHR